MIAYGNRIALSAAVAVLAMAGPAAYGQALPWETFADTDSVSVCDVVNAASAELVVLRSTGELVIVSGVDLVIDDTFVDSDGFVFFGFDPAGVIAFADDGDGFRTLWWLSATGRVLDVDAFTAEPFETDLFPSDFSNVPCDACQFWDDRSVCIPAVSDFDGDGIADIDDICADTPVDEFADATGCSCSQLDDDVDGIDNCRDACPDTPFGEDVGSDGCLLVVAAPPTVAFSLCGSFGLTTIALTLCGLIGLRFSR